MLKTRILTAIVLLPLVIAGLFLTSPQQFQAVLIFIAILAGWEWAGFMGLKQAAYKAGYTVMMGVLITLGILFVPPGLSLSLGLMWWATALLAVVKYPASGTCFEQTRLMGTIGVLVIQPMVTAFIEIRQLQDGTLWLLYGLCLVWVADTGAYFAGRKWGKRKLAPNVSPGKTVEGLLGAVASTSLLSLVVSLFRGLSITEVVMWLLITAAIVLISVLGDLTESLFKRRVGMKDSGRILPGHGGVMDRIDSLTAALPLLAFAFVFGLISP